MVEARSRDRWNHTATTLAVVVNSNPYRKGKPLKPSDFHPHENQPAAAAPLKADLSILRTLVVKK